MTEIIASGGLIPQSTVTVDTVTLDTVTGETVTVETVTTVDGVAVLGPCYERLNRVTANTLPFALHEWHVGWCRHFLNCNPRIHDTPLFFVLRNSARVCVAIVPFVVSRRWVGPLKIVSVSLLGADPAITEVRTALIEPGYESLTALAVRAQLEKVPDWDWIHWVGISDTFAEALTNVGCALQRQPALADYVLDMPPSWEEFRRGLKRNIRESLRHCYNSLKRDNHRFELQVIEEPRDVRAALDRFLALHIMRTRAETSVMHPNRFASRVSRDFLYEVCERLAARGAVRIFELKIGAHIVASRIGFAVGSSLYLYYSGYDTAWSRYSVMTTTLAEAIKYAIAQGFKTVNLSPTKDVAKTRWSPRQVDYKAALEDRGRLRSRWLCRAYMKTRSAADPQSWYFKYLIPVRRDWH
jgi:CelD/BcsL family acetyltransferase involved in cellulose biosynthesis